MRSQSLLVIPVRPPFLLSPPIRRHLLRSRQTSTRLASSITTPPTRIVHPLIPPPGEHSGPLLRRTPNRALPSLQKSRIWLKTLPVFIALITISSLAIFNYQKSNSSTVNSVLYALRTNPRARDILGDEIYFASKVPWISGELNQLHGKIDISFWVKGTKAKARTRFVSKRVRRDGYFETLEWSLTPEGGEKVHLLEDGGDVFRKEGRRSNAY